MRICGKTADKKWLEIKFPKYIHSFLFFLHRSGSGSWGGVDESDEELMSHLGNLASPMDPGFTLQVDPPFTTTTTDIGQDDLHRGHPDANNLLSPEDEEVFRKRLAFFFMDPVQKYRAKLNFPWKLVLQIFKVRIYFISYE